MVKKYAICTSGNNISSMNTLNQFILFTLSHFVKEIEVPMFTLHVFINKK